MLEVLIMAMMLSLSLVDMTSARGCCCIVTKATCASTGSAATRWHGLRVVELKDV